MDSKESLNDQRLWLRLAYDGTDFFGWQKQTTTPKTIQGNLEECLSKIYNQPIQSTGSGRTDKGVHALNQWVHFDLPSQASVSNLAYRLQRMTSPSLTIKSLGAAPKGFHAIRSATSKKYIYRIWNKRLSNPFLLRYSWHLPVPAQIQNLNAMAQLFLGRHNFTSFQSAGTDILSPVRTIFKSKWILTPSGILEYHIEGEGFLKQMVRNLVGTMIHLQQKENFLEILQNWLQEEDRSLTAAPAPPQGLFLARVKYPQTLTTNA